MKVLYKKPIVFEEVETKSGAILKKIVIDENHFLLEQNPLKDSKYGNMYRKIKSKNPNFYLFWEIMDNEFTGEVIVAELMSSDNLYEILEKKLKS